VSSSQDYTHRVIEVEEVIGWSPKESTQSPTKDDNLCGRIRVYILPFNWMYPEGRKRHVGVQLDSSDFKVIFLADLKQLLLKTALIKPLKRTKR